MRPLACGGGGRKGRVGGLGGILLGSRGGGWKGLYGGNNSLDFNRRRTNVQQLTCNIDLFNSFYYLCFSFVLLELKPFVLKGKVLGGKF